MFGPPKTHKNGEGRRREHFGQFHSFICCSVEISCDITNKSRRRKKICLSCDLLSLLIESNRINRCFFSSSSKNQPAVFQVENEWISKARSKSQCSVVPLFAAAHIAMGIDSNRWNRNCGLQCHIFDERCKCVYEW